MDLHSISDFSKSIWDCNFLHIFNFLCDLSKRAVKCFLSQSFLEKSRAVFEKVFRNYPKERSFRWELLFSESIFPYKTNKASNYFNFINKCIINSPLVDKNKYLREKRFPKILIRFNVSIDFNSFRISFWCVFLEWRKADKGIKLEL